MRLRIIWGLQSLTTPLLAIALLGCSGAQEAQEKADARMQEFRESLTGATLAGYFTRGDGTLSEERYTIQSVTRLSGNTWLFQSRIQYGERDVTVPVPLQVQWAGDTPVITLTDLTIPGMGTFTARVLIYRERYAGTWWAGERGGQMFGRIEKEGE